MVMPDRRETLGPTADVFISYSRARSVEAAELASELADLGYEVWWDTSLLPTGSFGAEIDRQLDAAKAVIVIWSPESLRSKWVRSEASHGDRQDKLVNTHTADPGVVAGIPKPLDLIHSVGLDNIRAIIGALDRLGVPRSRGTAPPPSVAVPVSAADADSRLFAEVEKAASVDAYQFYLEEFPHGAHAPVVRFKLRGKTPSPAPAPESAPLRQGLVLLDVCRGEPGTGKVRWFKDLEIGPEMVVVPAGGAISAPIAIGRFALTFAEWDAAQAHPEWQKHSAIAPRKANDHGWGRGKQPVIDVSWHDATAYCAWLSKVTSKTCRLPAEAEWEYCCRAGTTTEFWWGDEISTSQANYDGNHTFSGGKKGEYRQRTVPVDSFEANPWGLYQVHGNVREWCETAYDASSRVLRGGSWDYVPFNLRSAVRSYFHPDVRNFNVGFRVARTL